MGYEKTLMGNLNKVLEAESADEIREFRKSLKENLTTSVQLMFKSTAFYLLVLSSHYLLQYDQIESVELGKNVLSDSVFLRTALLWLGAAGFAAMILTEYLRRCYREALDYIIILSGSELTKTGLHDFSVPANYFLALDLLRDDGSSTGRFSARILQGILQSVIIVIPLVYLVIQLSNVIINQPSESPLYAVVASSAVVIILMALMIIWKSIRLSDPKQVARQGS